MADARFLHSPTLKYCLGAIAALVTFAGGGQVQAQIGLSPMVVQEEISRGRAQGILNVSNPGDQPLRVRVYAEPFTYDRENGFSLLTEDDGNSLSPYLQFSPREFVVPAGQSQRVRLVGLIPPSLEESEYRAVIFTEALTEDDANGSNQTTIQTRVGATVYFYQPGTEPLLTAERAEWNAQNNQIELVVGNAGNITARPSARWTLTRDGETITSGDSGATTVMESKDRLFQLMVEDSEALPLSAGNYELTGDLSWRLGSEAHSQPFTLPFTIQ